MKSVHFLALGSLAVSFSSQAMAKADILTGTTPWKMDYATDACHLQRAFGAGDKPVFLDISRLSPGDRFSISVTGANFADIASSDGVTLTAGPAGRSPIATTFTRGEITTTDNHSVVTLLFSSATLNGQGTKQVQPAPVTPQQEAAVTSLTVSWRENSVQLATGSLGSPLAAMRDCTANLVKSWGLDPEQQEHLSEKPQPLRSPQYWFQDAPVPKAAPFPAHALIDFRLLIDASGLVTDCRIVADLGSPGFAETTCQHIKSHIHFKPARDAEGKPVASYFTSRVDWILH